MKKLAAYLFTVALAFQLLVGSAFAQVGNAKVAEIWTSQGRVANITANTTSAAAILPAAGSVAFLCNTGSIDAYVGFGASSVAVTVAGGSLLRAGQCGAYDLLPFGGTRSAYVATITGSSTTTIYVEAGQGTPPSLPPVGGTTSVTGAVSLTAPTTGGCTPGVMLTAATNNSTSIKGAAGILCELTVINTTVTAVDVRLYDVAVAPTCSSATGVVANYPVQANTVSPGFALPLGAYGKQFTLGIGICVTGANANNDNTNAVTGINVNWAYK